MAEDVASISTSDGNGLLSVDQMARFVVDGYLEFGDLIPEELNRAVYEDQLQCVVGSELKEEYNLTVLMAEQNFHQATKIADRIANVLSSVWCTTGPRWEYQ